MCGRVTLALDKQTVLDILGDVFKISNQPVLKEYPNYNIGPGAPVLSLIGTKEEKRAGYLHWGFVPSWAEDVSIGFKLINTRSEGIDEKMTFKESFSTKRCIVLADSFYEWKKDKTKRPFRFQATNQIILPLAGLYSTYTNTEGVKLHTCSIITCEANQIMAPIHHRMPVILTPNTSSLWLDNSTQKDVLLNLLSPYPNEFTHSYEVSPFVNSIKNNTSRCIEPFVQEQQTLI